MTTPLDISEYRARLWYGSRVERWFCGVFEGGAAKGVAYPGALEALAEHGAWFHAVAGTSAGAITAAYVASGADPGDAKAFTIEMFGRLEAGPTVRRLIERGTLYSGRALRDWLDEQLAAQVAAITGREPARPVSFASLYAASGIELFIVATNLSLNEQIVFSHLATPACGVAEAAVASSATPLIFESRMLEIPSSNRTWHHTIVDGGLWSNFPMFVFAEAAFRRAHGAEPVVIDARDVLGFLLDDTAVPAIEIDSRIVFVADDEPVEAFEWSLGRPRAAAWWCRAAGAALAALAFVARRFDRTRRLDKGRWPDPATPCARHALALIDAIFGAVSPLWVGIALWIVVATCVGVACWQWFDLLRDGAYPGWLAVASWLIIAVFALPLLGLLLLAFLTNTILLKPARRMLYSLIKTYLATGGARSWDMGRDNVVSLPVPRDLSALNFEEAIRRHGPIMEQARRTTARHLAARAPGSRSEPGS